eukprot:5509739-Pleurochrysis_carterae.AAC.1
MPFVVILIAPKCVGMLVTTWSTRQPIRRSPDCELARGGDPSDGHGRTEVGRPLRHSAEPAGQTPVDQEPDYQNKELVNYPE